MPGYEKIESLKNGGSWGQFCWKTCGFERVKLLDVTTVVMLIAQDLIGQPPRRRIRCQYVTLLVWRLASWRSVTTIGEFLTSIGTTFAGCPVTDSRNSGLI